MGQNLSKQLAHNNVKDPRNPIGSSVNTADDRSYFTSVRKRGLRVLLETFERFGYVVKSRTTRVIQSHASEKPLVAACRHTHCHSSTVEAVTLRIEVSLELTLTCSNYAQEHLDLLQVCASYFCEASYCKQYVPNGSRDVKRIYRCERNKNYCD